jgi:ribonuclease E
LDGRSWWIDIESTSHQQRKGNIYKGRVTRVEPSLEAAFMDYGVERQGFLPLKEISRADFQNYDPRTPMAQVRIQDVITEGQEMVVQVG